MKGFTLKCLFALLFIQGLAACATLDRFLPVIEAPSIENQRAATALTNLAQLQEVDAYIRIDNAPLREQIRTGLEAQALSTGTFEFSRLRVRFARQLIALEGAVLIANGEDEALKASLQGDVILTFSGTKLIWLPHFNELEISESEFNYKEQFYEQSTEELESDLLQNINSNIADAVILLGKNMVLLNPLPLGEIEVGAELSNLSGVSATGTHKLGGVFTVAASSIFIESGITSIALDLEFIPNISSCPSDLYVSRSTFASEIINREPKGVVRLLNEGEGESYFFTEISGATRSTTIVHYWFADGIPVALEELQVEPSYRWRTWSSKSIDRSLAANWEVIVVEKQTGCILHSQSIHADPKTEPALDEQPLAREVYEQLRNEFESRVSSFSISTESPEVALIEVPRPFLNDVLHASLKDIHLVVNFDLNNVAQQRMQGRLRPFDDEEIICEAQTCEIQSQCVTGFTQCTRQRDSRDCTRCLFRNPLNNRCLNEGTDPICEAAKTAQNEFFETRRLSCLEQESEDTQNCQRLEAQQISSCELEASNEQSACATGKKKVREFSGAGAFATVELKLDTDGSLSSVFSGFEIEGELENLRLKLGFTGVLNLTGSIRFAPKPSMGPLTECMNTWQKTFNARVVMPYLSNSMIGVIKPSISSLSTDWSGFELRAPISPAPLEAMFVENPRLLAGCQIGLTVEKVRRAIDGAASVYLAGLYPLEIQPTPSRINLGGASIEYGEIKYQADAELDAKTLKYDIRE